MSATVLLERRGAVARLVLNRPEGGNALTLDMARALLAATIECDEDTSVRCVVLTGAGRLFCAGGDVASFAEAGARVPAFIKDLTGQLHLSIAKLARMDKPLLTAINGPAAGAGLSLAVLGDIALAARSAHFTLAYPGIGLTPDGGATWLLPRLIGLRRTQEMAALNERVGAEAAAAMGLVTRVVDDEAFAGEVDALANRLANAATGALGRTRNLLLQAFSASLESQMEAESRAIAAASGAYEGREGVAAFRARRKPDFTSPGGSDG